MLLGNRPSSSLTGTTATKLFVIFIVVGVIAMGIVIFQAYQTIQQVNTLTAEEMAAIEEAQ